MGEIKEEKERDTTHKVLSLWTGKESEWLTYKEIVKKLRCERVSERTVARYLLILVREKKLEKEERGYKKTFYRPYDEFLKTLSLSRDWLRIHEVFLSRTGRDLINKIEQSLVDAEETGKRMNKLICKEIEKIARRNSTLTADEISDEALHNVLSREKLEKTELQILVSKVRRFIYDVIYHPLSNPHGCAGTIEPYVVLGEIEGEITRLLSSYVELWGFMYKHPGASFAFEKYIRENFPTLFSNT